MSAFCICLCTCPDKATARHIARQLVTEKLAACVNIIDGVESIYCWQDKLHTDAESQLVIKTASSTVAKAEQRLLELHPYDTPEWLVLDVAAGNPDYLDWMRSQLNEV